MRLPSLVDAMEAAHFPIIEPAGSKFDRPPQPEVMRYCALPGCNERIYSRKRNKRYCCTAHQQRAKNFR